MKNPFDRKAESLGNITALEHVNVEIPNQGLASDFYLLGCGFTRDPYLFPGTNNMWVNIGRSQFHLPTGDALVLRGHIGIVSPDREGLLNRLQGVKKQLKDTKFKFKEHNDYVAATCPWGNKLHIYEPDEKRFGKVNLGIPYVEYTVPAGTADGLAATAAAVANANPRSTFTGEAWRSAMAPKNNGDTNAARAVVAKAQGLMARKPWASSTVLNGTNHMPSAAP